MYTFYNKQWVPDSWFSRHSVAGYEQKKSGQKHFFVLAMPAMPAMPLQILAFVDSSWPSSAHLMRSLAQNTHVASYCASLAREAFENMWTSLNIIIEYHEINLNHWIHSTNQAWAHQWQHPELISAKPVDRFDILSILSPGMGFKSLNTTPLSPRNKELKCSGKVSHCGFRSQDIFQPGPQWTC